MSGRAKPLLPHLHLLGRAAAAEGRAVAAECRTRNPAGLAAIPAVAEEDLQLLQMGARPLLPLRSCCGGARLTADGGGAAVGGRLASLSVADTLSQHHHHHHHQWPQQLWSNWQQQQQQHGAGLLRLLAIHTNAALPFHAQRSSTAAVAGARFRSSSTTTTITIRSGSSSSNSTGYSSSSRKSMTISTTAARASAARSSTAADIGARARQRQQQRVWSLAISGTAVAGFAIVALNAFQENLMFYITPTQALERFETEPTKNRFRLGGLVLEGSVKTSATSTEIEFVVTDLATDILVRYRGALPDLFREGHSVVAEGFLRPSPAASSLGGDTLVAGSGSSNDSEVAVSAIEDVTQKARGLGVMFQAMEVLAKHDEKYMPKEVAAAVAANKARIEAVEAEAEVVEGAADVIAPLSQGRPTTVAAGSSVTPPAGTAAAGAVTGAGAGGGAKLRGKAAKLMALGGRAPSQSAEYEISS